MSKAKYREITKVLTLMASILIALTFVAGICGMNFDNMPELHTRNGYFVVLGVMLTLGTEMFFYFRKIGWIGIGPPPPEFRAGQSDFDRRSTA